MAGVRLLAKLMERYGNVLAMAAAYNGGEGLLNRPWEKWPIESRNYVQKVVIAYPSFRDNGWKSKLPRSIQKTSRATCFP